jgi:hypothetical protein
LFHVQPGELRFLANGGGDDDDDDDGGDDDDGAGNDSDVGVGVGDDIPTVFVSMGTLASLSADQVRNVMCCVVVCVCMVSPDVCALFF